MEFGGFRAARSDFAWNSEDFWLPEAILRGIRKYFGLPEAILRGIRKYFGLPVFTVLLIAALHDPKKTGRTQ